MSLQTCSHQGWEDHDSTSDDDGARLERHVQRLLDALAAGNHAAFWPLWDLYKGHLYHVCLWQMDGVREDAEDALSRSMLRALDKLPRMCGRIQNVGAWLSRLTVNLCVDMHREQKRDARRLENIDDVLPAAGEVLQADADSPETVFLHREAIDYVCDVINDCRRASASVRAAFLPGDGVLRHRRALILTTENVRKRIQQARTSSASE
jgi:RNA polymerase sigma-70 factor (ECF subfamily)